MANKLLKQLISLIALIIAVIHNIFPQITLDGITLGLIALATLPWVVPIIKSLELPGGFKIELQEFEKAAQRADSVGLLSKESATAKEKTTYSFQTIAESDPNLALAGLRIEIEKRLKRLAELNGIGEQPKGVRMLLNALAERKILSFEERAVLSDMIGLLNSAVHGAQVDQKIADWAMDIGPQLIGTFDSRISASNQQQNDQSG